MAIKSEWVRYGDQLGYLALPEHAATPLPGVVVIHDLLGLNDHIEDVTRRICAAGYVALAPDLFASGGGRPAPLIQERIQEAMTFLSRLSEAARSDRAAREAELARLPEPERLRIGESIGQLFAFAAPGRWEDLVGALRKAVRHLRCERPETLGHKVACMGEELSILLACGEPELSGAAVFYASAPPAARLVEIRCPLIAFYGANDTHTSARVPGFAEAMREAGKSFEYHIYEGAGRGFFCDTKPNYYDVRASRAAFARLLTFFLKALAE
ncbi:MAG: dienelactone hydrolase family protein [Bryobacteraceae bacterium]|jgi:carboxymethylenebutenolidase